MKIVISGGERMCPVSTWPGNWVKVLRPKRGESHRATLLGRFLEVLLHWSDGDIPCWGSACVLCPKKIKRKYYAAAAYLKLDQTGVNRVRPGVIELHEEHMESFEDKEVRGLEIKISKNSSGTLFIAELRPAPPHMGIDHYSDFNVIPFLERWLGYSLTSGEADDGKQPEVLKFRKQA